MSKTSKQMSAMCLPLVAKREALENVVMTIEGSSRKSYVITFHGSMYDEKLQRMGVGQLSSG